MSDNSKHSNDRNNAGTIGSEGGVEKEGKGSFHKFTENLKEPEAPNVRGIRENEENHAVGSAGQRTPEGGYKENEADPNQPGYKNSQGKDLVYPKNGPNHADNLGGTSQKEVDDANNL